jgi:hypothetical protein
VRTTMSIPEDRSCFSSPPLDRVERAFRPAFSPKTTRASAPEGRGDIAANLPRVKTKDETLVLAHILQGWSPITRPLNRSTQQ